MVRLSTIIFMALIKSYDYFINCEIHIITGWTNSIFIFFLVILLSKMWKYNWCTLYKFVRSSNQIVTFAIAAFFNQCLIRYLCLINFVFTVLLSNRGRCNTINKLIEYCFYLIQRMILMSFNFLISGFE